ncbi:cupredoxin domain-containing protein [Microbulbifer sp. SA54]|uniref:cupredoxin domain-containing protein n=1 Tax=Microbulbifer sp. SA54 TaxID=3401577 RepID=UPI003AAE7F14
MISALINIAGLLLIAAIVWWFWIAGKKSSGERYQESLVIRVNDGVYEPDHITVPAGQAVVLQFLREDPSPCAEYVVFSDLDISTRLPVHETVEVKLPALEAGEYPFTCQMKMYRGLLVAE